MILFRTGDCIDVFGAEPDASFDAFVSDWPAGVAFMGRQWDKAHGGRDAWVRVWAERAAMMRRKAKPGAYSLTWALPRTSHWTATALDDAGWEIQDVITHVFGQGWPKGRAALKPASEHWILARNGSGGALQIDASRVARGAGDLREQLSGRTSFGLISDDAFVPRQVEYKPNEGGSWPANFVLSHCPECEERGTRRVKGGTAAKHNTGGNVSGLFDLASTGIDATASAPDGTETVPAFDCVAACDCGLSRLAPAGGAAPRCVCGAAMWWACPVAQLDADSGHLQSGFSPGFLGEVAQANAYGAKRNRINPETVYADAGGASRFFHRFTYQAKAAGGERHAGCEDLFWRVNKRNPFGFDRTTRAEWEALSEDERAEGNVHPTVKSIDLMEHLVGLVTPTGGRCGDITAGSGGTGIALHRLNITRNLGASFLGCDICPEAVAIAEARLAWWRAVRHDVKPVKVSGAPEADPRQVTIFDMLGGAR